MALKIRLQRAGATHNPVHRIVVTEATARRDGRFVEKLGTYLPKQLEEVQLTLNVERAEYWMSVGAKPSDTVNSLIKRARKEAAAAAETATA